MTDTQMIASMNSHAGAGSRQNQRIKLTGAAILVSRGTMSLQAAPAAYPYRYLLRTTMALFASIVAFIDIDKSRVERALAAYAELHHGLFSRIAADAESQPTIVHESNGHGIIAFGREVGDEDQITAELSESLDAFALYLHIHDGDLWLYVLYESGKEVESFNVRPTYWDGPPPSQTMSPTKIYDALPSCVRGLVDKYFCEWTPDLEGQKAYANDRYEYHNCWQLMDFMAALGLESPWDDAGKPRGGTFEFLDGDWLRARLAKLHEIGAPDVFIRHDQTRLDRLVSSKP